MSDQSSIYYLDKDGTKHIIDVIATEVNKKIEMEDAVSFEPILTPEFNGNTGGGSSSSSDFTEEELSKLKNIIQYFDSISDTVDDSEVDAIVDDILGGDST